MTSNASTGGFKHEPLQITVLADQVVPWIRTKLQQAGIHYGWDRIRPILSVQRRVTVSFVQKNGQSIHVRKATKPEPE